MSRRCCAVLPTKGADLAHAAAHATRTAMRTSGLTTPTTPAAPSRGRWMAQVRLVSGKARRRGREQAAWVCRPGRAPCRVPRHRRTARTHTWPRTAQRIIRSPEYQSTLLLWHDEAWQRLSLCSCARSGSGRAARPLTLHMPEVQGQAPSVQSSQPEWPCILRVVLGGARCCCAERTPRGAQRPRWPDEGLGELVARERTRVASVLRSPGGARRRVFSPHVGPTLPPARRARRLRIVRAHTRAHIASERGPPSCARDCDCDFCETQR